MNNIIKETEELKQLVIESNEYKNYTKYLSLLEKDKEINELIKRITTLQKKIVNLKHKRINTVNQEKELDSLYFVLNENKKYKDYIRYSKELNILISNIQKQFQEFFDSLVS